MRHMHSSTNEGQKGFVSIVVSIIIMTILSLITIGFAQLMAREQRQVLDRQLSAQAFYAAESGVNDVALAVRTGVADASYDASCAPPANITADGIDWGVRNTCTTYSSIVNDIRSDAVPPSAFDPRVYPLRVVSGTTTEISFNFSPTNRIDGIPRFRPTTGGVQLPPAGTAADQWNASTGVMKVYIIPFRNGMSRQQLIDAMAYFTFYPRDSGSTSVVFTAGTGAGFGSITPVACNDTSGCTIRITGIDAITYDDMFMVVNAVYQPNNIVIDARSVSGSQQFRDVQAVVDSTGRTTDVLRRIQVRLPLQERIVSPLGALIATDPAGAICKLYETNAIRTTATGGCQL